MRSTTLRRAGAWLDRNMGGAAHLQGRRSIEQGETLMRWGILWVGLLFCGFTARAQRTLTVEPPAGTSAAGRPPSTMTFDVAVTDKAGKPLTGLKAADFTVLDNGKAVKIADFAGYGPATATSRESAIVVIDDVNTEVEDLMVAQQQIGQLLKMHEGHLPLPVSFMLLTDSRLRQIAAPSQDGNVLRRELAKMPGIMREMPNGGFYHAEDRLAISMRGLLVLAAEQSRVPGRKIVIWLSPGWWMFDNPEVITWNRQEKAVYRMDILASQALRQAHITLDAIDPLGMEDVASIYRELWKTFMKPVTRWTQAQAGDLALQVLAAQSGGDVVWGGNNVAEEIEATLNEARSWYEVTVAVPQDAPPDSWQGVQVRVNQPGAQVQTQNGYYVVPTKPAEE